MTEVMNFFQLEIWDIEKCFLDVYVSIVDINQENEGSMFTRVII